MDKPSLERPMLVFDGECPFCRVWVEYWKRLTGEQILYEPFQEVGSQFPQISQGDFASAVKLVLPDGEVRSGAHAVFSALDAAPGRRWMSWFYERVSGFAAVSETIYAVIARHRALAYRVTSLLWGIPLAPQTYRLSGWLFLRLLGMIYFIAFASFGVQAAGLIGAHGILPVAEFLPAVRNYLGAAAYWNVPTIFWLGTSDTSIKAVWIAGVCFSALLVIGVDRRVVRVALFVLYLSVASAGQVFMSYQWDALLLEAGFLAIFLGSSLLVIWLFRWLLFRLMFLSGAVKLLSGDPLWRRFTALPVHYLTQPLPTTLAWYMYQLPAWFHRVSVGFVFLVELIIPFLIFAPRRVRALAGIPIVLLQLLIFLTGNYAFFNLLTVSLCIFLWDDVLVSRVLPKRISERVLGGAKDSDRRVLRSAACGTLAVAVMFVSGFQLAGMFWGFRWAPAEKVIHAVSPFEIVNTYGLFAVMTDSRPEIVIEGSNDGVTWFAYEFKYKPGDLKRRPIWVQPHQPRLDWQMWFAALGSYESDPWIIHFMERLLEGSPDVLRLLKHNPFPEAPPRYARALAYEYGFTTAAERKGNGQWWQRELKSIYVPVVSLRTQP
jgi:predicted DCC family thiol-disulfide oxidoreductase YuxK